LDNCSEMALPWIALLAWALTSKPSSRNNWNSSENKWNSFCISIISHQCSFNSHQLLHRFGCQSSSWIQKWQQ
jgi:hypothetical protein